MAKKGEIAIFPEEIADIRRRWQEGQKTAEIVEATGRCATTVRKVLVRHGDAPSEHHLTREEEDALLQLYEQGATLEEIKAAGFRSGHRLIYLVLERRNGYLRTDIEAYVAGQARQLYERGWSSEEVAAYMDLSRSAAEQLIHRAGGKFRPLPPLTSTDLRAMAIDRYTSGMTVTAVANVMGKDPKTIRNWLRAAGCETDRRKRIRLDFS